MNSTTKYQPIFTLPKYTFWLVLMVAEKLPLPENWHTCSKEKHFWLALILFAQPQASNSKSGQSELTLKLWLEPPDKIPHRWCIKPVSGSNRETMTRSLLIPPVDCRP